MLFRSPKTGILHFYAGYPNLFTYENGKVHFTTPDYNPFGVDFLWGLRNVECSSHSNSWKIKMKHALARVNIYFDVEYGDVYNVKVAASRKGTFTPTSTEDIPIWEVDDSQKNELIGVNKVKEDIAAILFVFPGKINKLRFQSSLKGTIDFSNIDPPFEAGKEYNIYVSPTGISIVYVPSK